MATIWIADTAVQSFRSLTAAKEEAARLRWFYDYVDVFIMPA
jgi:hypothetical protein